jgi:hypothetical protein
MHSLHLVIDYIGIYMEMEPFNLPNKWNSYSYLIVNTCNVTTSFRR